MVRKINYKTLFSILIFAFSVVLLSLSVSATITPGINTNTAQGVNTYMHNNAYGADMGRNVNSGIGRTTPGLTYTFNDNAYIYENNGMYNNSNTAAAGRYNQGYNYNYNTGTDVMNGYNRGGMAVNHGYYNTNDTGVNVNNRNTAGTRGGRTNNVNNNMNTATGVNANNTGVRTNNANTATHTNVNNASVRTNNANTTTHANVNNNRSNVNRTNTGVNNVPHATAVATHTNYRNNAAGAYDHTNNMGTPAVNNSYTGHNDNFNNRTFNNQGANHYNDANNTNRSYRVNDGYNRGGLTYNDSVRTHTGERNYRTTTAVNNANRTAGNRTRTTRTNMTNRAVVSTTARATVVNRTRVTTVNDNTYVAFIVLSIAVVVLIGLIIYSIARPRRREVSDDSERRR